MTAMEKLVEKLTRAPEYADRLAHYRFIPAQPAQATAIDDDCLPPIRRALTAMGLTSLYSHQAQAWAQLRQGIHTGVTTPTASGKTLIYNLAVTEALAQDPSAKALYLFPLKALAQDQLKTVQQFLKNTGLPDLSAAVYDGDTADSVRAKLRRKPPSILLTNPDMLHYGMLAFPQAWQEFFRQLRFVVIDEAHTYRGVFGSHVALILRRLRRLCGNPGPTVMAGSATMANAKEFLETLTGLPFSVIDQSGAPRQGRHVVLLNPVGSPYSDAAAILRECLEHEIKTILFTKSRKIAELIHIWVRDASPEYAKKIAAYRAGYLPADRRKIEQELFQNRLSAVITTSALEAGIDIGGLDAAVLVGYPGTMISTWQRVGRAGRQNRDALMVLIALPDALDQYYLRHPDAFFASKFENCVLDPNNPQILRRHLPCAAAEEPIAPAEEKILGTVACAMLPQLTQEGWLQETANGQRYLASLKQPHRSVDIRSVGEQYLIKTEREGVTLGSIDGSRVFKECHPGAIYLQAGSQYEVVGLDLDSHTVMARETDANWYTQYTSSEEVEILDLAPGEQFQSAGQFQAGQVLVRVTEKIVAYERRRVRDQSLLSEHKLDLPPRVFETQAALIIVPEEWRRRSVEFGMNFAGGLHAVEHTLIASLPVKVLCDRWDLGGLSTLVHPQVNHPCIFIYEAYPGGLGLVAKGLAEMGDWLLATREMVEKCECEDGCPACIQSPKCGSRNQPLDKRACLMVLNAALREPMKPLKKSRNGLFQYAPVKAASCRASASSMPVSGLDETMPAMSANIPAAKAEERHLVVFDLETQRSAAEVGGWGQSHRMGMSLGVVYDHSTREYTTYREDRVQELIQHLLSADVVVGFNINKFDLAVLSAYSPHVQRIKTLDIIEDVFRRLRFRLSLDHLGQHTLGKNKSAEGLQAITWFQQGRWQELESYCRMDVEITRDLFFFGVRYQYLLYERQGAILKLPVEWDRQFPWLTLPKL